MSTLKRTLVFILAGAVAGTVVGTLIARSFIPWYWTPGNIAQGQQLCDIAAITRGTIDALVRDQLIGAAVGAVLVGVAGSLAARALAKRKEVEGAAAS